MNNLFNKGVMWRDQNKDRSGILGNLLHQHLIWLQTMLDKYHDLPLGYTEWTLSGQLAIAASNLDYYAVQEYFLEKKPSSSLPYRRPDLYVWGKSRGSFVFEIKRCWISIHDKSDSRFINKEKLEDNVKGILSSALSKIYEYRRYLMPDEKPFRCSLLVAEMWIEKDIWDSKYKQGGLNLRGHLNNLRTEIRSIVDNLPKKLINFFGGWTCSHQEMNLLRKHNYSPIPLGMLYLGRCRPPNERGV